MQALKDALSLVNQDHLRYLTANATERRLINQAIFHRLTITSTDEVEAEPTPPYAELARLARDLAPATGATSQNGKPTKTGRNKTRRSPQKDHDPISWGRGSYIEQMAERAGFEPAMGFYPHTRLAGECLQPLGHLSLDGRQV